MVHYVAAPLYKDVETNVESYMQRDVSNLIIMHKYIEALPYTDRPFKNPFGNCTSKTENIISLVI